MSARRSPSWRGAGVALCGLTAACGSVGAALPELPVSHPAHPHAAEAPVPPRPPTLAFPTGDGEARTEGKR